MIYIDISMCQTYIIYNKMMPFSIKESFIFTNLILSKFQWIFSVIELNIRLKLVNSMIVSYVHNIVVNLIRVSSSYSKLSMLGMTIDIRFSYPFTLQLKLINFLYFHPLIVKKIIGNIMIECHIDVH